MAVQGEAVAHNNLVAGGETALHSHAGGGNGPTIKAGTVTTNGGGIGAVTFTTAFPDTNYAIALSAEDAGDTTTAMWYNKTTSGFSVKTEDDGGKDEGGVEVLWIATPYANP